MIYLKVVITLRVMGYLTRSVRATISGRSPNDNRKIGISAWVFDDSQTSLVTYSKNASIGQQGGGDES